MIGPIGLIGLIGPRTRQMIGRIRGEKAGGYLVTRAYLSRLRAALT